MEYTITYKAKNIYKETVFGATWQFLILPQKNANQTLEEESFTNSLNVPIEKSINGYGFNTYRIRPKMQFREIEFQAEFRLFKEIVNPFSQSDLPDIEHEYKMIDTLDFRAEHESFLKTTLISQLPKNGPKPYIFDQKTAIIDNLKAMNSWIFSTFKFKANVTQINTNLSEILQHKHGVCQDFTHLFCAIARQNGIPARYVSGYLNQGIGYLGDSQMHAWAECFVPQLGWIGFDPTNNLLAAENHIKVAHGKDYSDCPPIKGVVYTAGTNTTSYSVSVHAKKEGGMQQSIDSDGNMHQSMGDMQQMKKLDFTSFPIKPEQ